MTESERSTARAALHDVMSDGRARTLPELREAIYERTGVWYSETGVSARIRDLRKKQYGAHDVRASRGAGGFWRYRIVPPPPPATQARLPGL